MSKIDLKTYGDYIGRIMHMIYLYLDESLFPYDITHQQAKIVRFLHELELNGLSIHQKQLESKMGLRGSSITSLLQGLEKKGFIRRVADEVDARKKFIYLTNKGYELDREFVNIFNQSEELLVEVISQEEKELLFNILKRITLHLEEKEKERMT